MTTQPTFVPPTEPPKTKKEMVARLRNLLELGWLDMTPGVARYNGTGGPGNFLEDMLGLTSGSKDIPDCIGWDVKWVSPLTHLITMFHKECDDSARVMRYMVSKHGWRDVNGRLSFRHTIKGTSDRFKVYSDAGSIIVRPLNGNGIVPIWSHDTLLNACSKLRRLVVVQGVKSGTRVRFDRADLYENMHMSQMAEALTDGRIAIDFDVREAKAGSKGLRNHGTKFRIAPDALRKLYDKHERL